MSFFIDIYNKFFKDFLAKGELWTTVWHGLLNTLMITAVALVMGLVLGMLFGVIKVMPRRNAGVFILQKFAGIYTTVFRGTPVLVQLFFFYYAIFSPLLHIKGLYVAFLVFGLNSGAYMTESIRSGILAVDSGQMEAGRSLGLPFRTSMLKIIMPQAIKNILPALGNEAIALLKDTSIASVITVSELTRAVQNIASKNYEYTISYLFLGLAYLVIVMIMTFFTNKLERRLRKSDHR
ncbi:MAG: amino acid ABC transporter permease [Oscillospiraceae bacterium]|nr:amino acid ABC transporter permease [Oscillospiraceae bacterium]